LTSALSLAFAGRQHKERLARALCAPPLDLLQANIHVERIKIVLVFVSDQFPVDCVGVIEFGAMFNA
jgi:hypothetical protein